MGLLSQFLKVPKLTVLAAQLQCWRELTVCWQEKTLAQFSYNIIVFRLKFARHPGYVLCNRWSQGAVFQVI